MLIVGFSINLDSAILKRYVVGSKASAMGGAFVGLADDYSAIFWNPAGLSFTRQKSFFVTSAPILTSGTYTFDDYNIKADSSSKSAFIGAVGYIKPINKKIVVGIAGYVNPMVGMSWDIDAMRPMVGDSATAYGSSITDYSISPAISYRFSASVQMGLALNVHHVKWELDNPGFFGQYSESLKGTGIGATFGILASSFQDACTIGVTVKSPVRINLSGNAEMGAPIGTMGVSADTKRSLDIPMWIGAGLALKTYRRLWATFDVHYTKWSSNREIGADFSDPAWTEYLDSYLKLRWKQRTQIRFGLLYKASKNLSLRAGYYKDPTPSNDEPITLLFPSANVQWITCGFGYRTKNLIIEASVEFSLKANRNIRKELRQTPTPSDDPLANPLPTIDYAECGKISFSSIVPTFSLTYRF